MNNSNFNPNEEIEAIKTTDAAETPVNDAPAAEQAAPAETVADTTYILYTLRFKVGRSAAKQRDEQVYQIVHIAVPSGETTLIGKIDTILGVGVKPTASVEDGD